MSHLDPGRLTLVALGDEPADFQETDHLAACPGCHAQLDHLRALAERGRETQQVRDLPPVPNGVWAGIQAAVFAAVPVQPAPRRRGTVLLAVAAAVVALLIVTVGLVRPGQPPIVATARLDRLPAAPAGAGGTARIVRSTVRVHVTGMPLQPGYYEVWLLDPDTDGMISLGSLGAGPDAAFPLPARVDLGRYRMIDVSAEPFDGNPAHSDRSMLRGSLTY